jgi:serine/threonine-protein kinase
MTSAEMGFEDSLADIVSPGDVVAGKYRVDRVIGTGGMGVVVEAFHLHFEERVAIKFLVPQMGANEEALARFEREARAAFKIKSEHVARVIDVGKLNGRVPYMVMEYLEGTDLGVMLTDRRAFPIEDAVEYVLQAIEAVAEAHTLQIVHRDLKPENLFLTKRADGTACIKVLDFGLSKALTPEPAEQRPRALTGTAQVMGTPQYMSPEQWMSARDVGAATDQWALGVILYELVTGLQPFDQEQLAQLCTQVLRSEPDPIAKHRANVPPGLEQVVLRCLRKEPKDRYPNVGELSLALLPFAPARARQTVKRIAGVFKRAGVDPGAVPPSTRAPGLGHNLVLGRPPASAHPTVPLGPEVAEAARAAVAAALTPQQPVHPHGNQPPPHPQAPVHDLTTTQLYSPPSGRESPPSHTAAMHMQGPSPLAAYVPRPRRHTPIEAPPSSGRTAVLSEPFPHMHAWPSYPDRQPDHASGQYQSHIPAPPPSQPYAAHAMHAPGALPGHPGGSGPYAAVAPAMAAPPGAPPLPQRRAITAQSWQHMLDLSTQASRDKRVVVAVVGAVVACVAIAIFLLVGVSSGASPDPSTGVRNEPQATAPSDDHGAVSGAPGEDAEEGSAASPEPSTPTSSSASAPRAGQAYMPPRGARPRPAPTSGKPTKPKDKGRIFDSRN